MLDRFLSSSLSNRGEEVLYSAANASEQVQIPLPSVFHAGPGNGSYRRLPCPVEQRSWAPTVGGHPYAPCDLEGHDRALMVDGQIFWLR